VPSFTVRDLPASVHAALKREAKRQDRSLNKIVVMALSDYADSLTERAVHLARLGRTEPVARRGRGRKP